MSAENLFGSTEIVIKIETLDYSREIRLGVSYVKDKGIGSIPSRTTKTREYTHIRNTEINFDSIISDAVKMLTDLAIKYPDEEIVTIRG